MSDVSITTRTAEDDVSTVYELDRHGVIVNSKPSHLGVGVFLFISRTVIITNFTLIVNLVTTSTSHCSLSMKDIFLIYKVKHFTLY